MSRMKRLQISIEPELDAALGRAARSQGVSKAALVRRFVAQELKPLPPIEDDPLWDFVGKDRGASRRFLQRRRRRLSPLIFVDTSFWVAARMQRDAHHRDAVELLEEQRDHRLVTSNHVRGETWTFLRPPERARRRGRIPRHAHSNRPGSRWSRSSPSSRSARCGGCVDTTSASTRSSIARASC